MKLLALDTSTEACSAALLIDGQTFSRFELQPNQHSKLLLPMLDELLSEVNISLSSLDAVAFGCGPGSFTGLRIACSVTQGIAFAHDLPVIPVSSLQALAQTAYQDFGFSKVLSAIDAHVKAFYYGAFVWDELLECMQKVSDERLVSSENFVMPEGDCWEPIGTGGHYFDKKDYTNCYPKASAILSIARRMFTQKKWVAPEEALPTYLYDFKP